jgi:hypothetical protein
MKLYYLLIVIILSGILLVGCDVKKFTVPTWDVELNVPLMNEKYFVSDLIDSVNFFPAADNGIIFQSSGAMETLPVGEIVIPMNVDTDDLSLQSGVMLIDNFPLSNFQTGREVAYGLISNGNLRVDFSDMHPSVTQVNLTLLNVLNNENVPLSIVYEGGDAGYNLPLAGYHVGTDDSDIIVSDINFSVTIQSSEPEGTQIGFLRMTMFDDLKFSKFRGRTPSERIDVVDNQTHVDIEYPFGIENAIQLEDADILLHIESPMAYPFVLNGDFYAINYGTGEEATIHVLDNNGNPFIMNPRVGDSPGITDISFSNNVDQLLRIMPEYIELRNAFFDVDNSSGVIGEINSTDMISGEYIANSPLRFTLFHAMITPNDSMKIDISKDNNDIIRKNVLSASMKLGVLNQLPIGAETTIYFSTNPDLNPNDPSTWAFSRTVHVAAKANPNLEQIVPVSLSHDEIMLFTNPTVYMKQTFIFDASDGPVTITASPADFIQVRSMIGVEAHVEE